jgi:class 3 adenylate cyclase
MSIVFQKFLRMFGQLRNSFFAVIILIQVLLITLSVLFERMTVNVLEESQAENLKKISQSVGNAIDSAITSPKVALLTIAKNKAVLEAFAKKDRPALLAAALPIYEDLKHLGFKQFQFHESDGPSYKTFLRVHQPEKFGEDLAYRPMIFKSNAAQEVVAGLEQGKSGYGFRAVTPLSYQGKHIGSFEIGYDIGTPFLEQLKRDFPGSWAVYNLSRGVQAVDDRILMVTLGEDRDGEFKNLPLREDVLKKINTGETFFERDRASDTGTLYIPARNYRGDIVIVFKHVFDTNYFKRIQEIFLTAIVICLIGLALSSIIIYILNNLISAPMRKLALETEKIRAFHLDDEINFSSSLKEINELIESTKRMKSGLQSFQKYVPSQLVRQLIETNQEAVVGGQRREITVFFSDVADFTSISESLTPNELTAQLSEYLSVMTDTIMKHQGTVDKYIGDAVMAFWGAPFEMKNHAEIACKAALECQKRCEELNAKWIKEGKKPFHTRIGINSGEIVVGNMGSTQRLNYTIIGDEVNLASRMESLNKVYGTNCIISENTVSQISKDFALRLLDFVVVSGKTKPATIYELVAEKGDVRSIDLEFLKSFNECFALYKDRNWNAALAILDDLLKIKPQDKAAHLLKKRCETFKVNPPPENWRGEFVLREK